ncbi:hypothetical protein L914_17806 [Phytophthora nicotianae]|nr:hypothetical protein L914_17806 [Phytophthora nicotianae]
MMPEQTACLFTPMNKSPPATTDKVKTPDAVSTSPSPSRTIRACYSPTTSSPVLLESPPKPSPQKKTGKTLRSQRQERKERRAAASPYSRPRSKPQRTRGLVEAVPLLTPLTSRPASRFDDVFEPARWPCGVAHLREQFNPLATVFPAVPHSGLCGCWNRCRADTCRNARMHVFCNVNCCPYEGKCGNGLEESSKVFLGRNRRTGRLCVVAGEDIQAGEVLGQYLGLKEHVSVSRADRPRNGGYRLVIKQRPEKPSYPVCVAINAEDMGGLMRFLNHSCRPVTEFVEVSNGGRTTVVVVTTQDILRGEEVTVDYGDDLWFVCRCELSECRHSNIQDEEDPLEV